MTLWTATISEPRSTLFGLCCCCCSPRTSQGGSQAAYGWYTAALLVVVLTASNFESLERYGLGCFPFVIAASMLTKSPRSFRVVIALSASLLLVYAVMAFLGKYVP